MNDSVISIKQQLHLSCLLNWNQIRRNYNISYLHMNKSFWAALLIVLSLGATYFANKEHKRSGFEEWKQTYGIHYLTEYENEYRRVIFENNVEKINLHNSDPYKSYEMGINQFTGLTQEQFVEGYLNPMMNQNIYPDADGVVFFGEPNDDIDWTARGMVTEVKNQASCGSCWAFSTTGQLESYFLQRGTRVYLSEQQLVDCSGSFGNQGCNGGWPRNAMNYVRTYGITTTSAYPYVARNQPCKTQGGAYKISSIGAATGCQGLQTALASQTISVAVDATNWSPYTSGIFSNCNTALNHAVLLVGSSSSYWKIKNSWGTGWGEAGYIRIAQGNTCGICSHEGVWGI